ncbi:MAG: lysylphosphatidylglycerol synthase transmembrane domain-containing protein [Planctomycetota bacterium]
MIWSDFFLRILFLIAKTAFFCLFLIFILWILLVLDWDAFFKTFFRINPFWWMGALFIKTLVLGLRGFRCYLLFLPDSKLSLGTSIRYHILSQFGNVIFPAKMGEGAKVFLLKTHSDKSFWQVLFLVIGERILDAWCVFLALAFILQQPPFSNSFQIMGYFFGGIAGILTLFLCSALSTQWIEKLHLPSKLRKKSLLTLTLIIWAGEILGLSFFLNAFHLGNWYQAVAVTFFYHLAIAIPNTPGNIGVFEMVYVYAFGLFLIPPEASLSLACTVQMSLFLLYILLGFLVLSYEGMNVSTLKELGKKKQPQIVS